MGHLYELGNKTIWEPSTGVSELFLAQVRCLEKQVACTSGLSEVLSDFVYIDARLLMTFLQRTAAHLRWDNEPLIVLLHGALVLLLALALLCAESDEQRENVFRGYPVDWRAEVERIAATNMHPIDQR